jgi:hypothetical protein
LTHVVQQRAGVPLRNGVNEAHGVYESQADAMADVVLRSSAAMELPRSPEHVAQGSLPWQTPMETPVGHRDDGQALPVRAAAARGLPGRLQRMAVAAWKDATTDDKRYFVGGLRRGIYDEQQRRLDRGGKVWKPVQLPAIEKILELSANYHYYDKYPDPDTGGFLAFDDNILRDVEAQFHIGTKPDFWPRIQWTKKNGEPSEIGVRFMIMWKKHTLQPAATAGATNQDYSGESMRAAGPDGKTLPQDNFIRARRIDDVSQKELNASNIVALATKTGIRGFSYDASANTATFAPSDAASGSAETYTPDQTLALIKKVRDEAKKQGKSLENEVLGYAETSRLTLDPHKAGTVTYNALQPDKGTTASDYSNADQKDMRESTKTQTVSPETQKKIRVTVMTHEILHNIGMGHEDLGIMTPGLDVANYTKVPVQRNQTGSGASLDFGGSGGSAPRVMSVSFEEPRRFEQVTHHDVQLLADRIPAMTDFAALLPSPNEKPLQYSTSEAIGTLMQLLDGVDPQQDYQKIVKDPILTSLLKIPEKGRLWLDFNSAGKITDELKSRIKREIGPGITFFDTQEHRDAY